MQTHLTGSIVGSRQGSVVVDQSYVFDYTSPATSTPTKITTVKASPTNPVTIRLTGVVMTPSNAATTHTISVGTDAGAGLTAFLAAVDAKAAVNTNYVPASATRILIADTDIWFQQVITGATTAGKFAIFFDIAELNVKTPVTGD